MSDEKDKPEKGAPGGADNSSGAPEILEKEFREYWLDTLADMDSRNDRRYESLARRVTRLESKGSGFAMGDETKMIMVYVGLYIAVVVVLPMVLDEVGKWRARSS